MRGSFHHHQFPIFKRKTALTYHSPHHRNQPFSAIARKPIRSMLKNKKTPILSPSLIAHSASNRTHMSISAAHAMITNVPMCVHVPPPMMINRSPLAGCTTRPTDDVDRKHKTEPTNQPESNSSHYDVLLARTSIFPIRAPRATNF